MHNLSNYHPDQSKLSADLRVRRTYKLLRDAIVSLTASKPFSAIKIQELAETAMINRSTFYRHFNSKEDLVTALIKEMLTDIDVPRDVRRYPPTQRASRIMLAVLQVIQDNAAFFRVMFGEGGMAGVADVLREEINRIMYVHFEAEYGSTPPKTAPTGIPMELCVAYMNSSGMGLIHWWVKQDFEPSPQQVANWYDTLLAPGLSVVFGAPIEPSYSDR